ncbi:thiamine diphosphate-binding fold [Phytophthora cactorum]|nr:thiamine diphosphate-binding fold [Phytophthora cactorum]
MSPPQQQHTAAVEEAVSHVAYALSDFSYLVQPVPFGSALEKYIVSARRNVFDQVGKVEESSAGQELIERAYAAAARGQFVTLFASSPSALLQMVPAMYKLSSAQLPAVIHVVAREHSDLMAVRQTGFVILNSLNATETEDMALLAHVASLRANVPFLHVYDGEMAHNDLEQRVATSSSKFNNALVDYQYLANLIGLKNASETPEFRQLVLNKSGVSDNADDAELYFQVSPECIAKYNAVPEVVEDVIQQVLVVMGTASSVVKDAVESLYTNWKAKVGVISVRLFRPWSTKTFLSVVPASATKFAVLDRMDDATNVGEPLFMDVLGSFQSEEWQSKPIPLVIGGKYAFNVSESVFDVVTARTLVEELAADKLQSGFIVASPTATEEFNVKKTATTQLVNSYVSSKDGFEAPYVKMLLQLFEKRAVIANLVRSETVWKTQDKTASDIVTLENGEFGFGVHLGILAKRQELKDKVKALVSGEHAKEIVSQRLLECLVQWSDKQPKHEELANEITILLENEQHQGGVLAEIYALKQYFAPLSQWILGSEEFSRDVGASGVHQVLASGENVNLLILDTEPMNAVSRSNRKRDLGLYAMQYGNAYVASVALYDSYSQVLRALNEADAFDGPSIVLAYAPSAKNMEQETKEAVTSGYWPLYRYNPLLEDVEGEKAFSLESPSIKKELLTFLQRNNQLSLFAKQALTGPTAASVTEKYEQIGQQALKTSFEALLNGFGGQQQEPWQVDTKLWLLNVEKMDMNEMTINQLLDEANDENAYVVFVCSTAGQGEFPNNGKEFWGELSGFSSTLPLQYAVFGMGDSLYWPREDEKHYFCKAPVDLDAKLSELGAKRIIDLAKGDDQDEDGPMTQFETGSRSLAEGLEDRTTKALAADDTQLTKFHGIYQQDDRDLREQMRLEKKEKAFGFHDPSRRLARQRQHQAYYPPGLPATGYSQVEPEAYRAGYQPVLMDSLAACGDVNRNVMATVNPSCSVETHQEILDIARDISAHLTPKTSAYHEIWLDKKMVAGGEVKDFEPFYGEAYLPRKFKIAITIPPANDVDVFANCLGFIAILEKDKLIGFNVAVGGGMGMTHNNNKTYPRLADVMAFCTPDQAKDVAEKIMVLQRDFGDRVNRKHARFKYTVEDHGLEWIRAETEKRLGYKLEEPRKYKLLSNGDRFGWIKNSHGKYHYGMFVEGGRIKDTKETGIRSGLRELAKTFPHVEFHLTGNQNLSLGNISEDEIPQIKALMEHYKFGNDNYSGLRLNSIACAALPMCGLAFAEAERYLPSLVTKIEDMLEANGLRDDAIVIRMTGCPNGCGRPYLGEIGFLYKEAVDEAQILEELEPIIKDYAENRDQGEKFGDYVIRAGYVKACLAAPLVENRAAGDTFHA